MSVIGTVSMLVSEAAEPVATLESLVTEELREVLARKLVLEAWLAALTPELATVGARAEALKAVCPEAFEAVTGRGKLEEVRLALRDGWEYSDEGSTRVRAVDVPWIEWRLKKMGFTDVERESFEKHAEKFVDVLAYYGEVSAFWYLLRVLYKGDLEEFMSTYSEGLGCVRKSVSVVA
jgi:hypothetical protein